MYKVSMQNGGESPKKVIIIGDGFVGKTCLLAKVTEGKFINNYHCTIGGKWTGNKRSRCWIHMVFMWSVTVVQIYVWLICVVSVLS